MEIADVIQGVKSAQNNLERIIIWAVESEEDYLQFLITSQLNESKSAKGLIKPEYSPNYAKLKGFKNPNLKDTGQFWGAIGFDDVTGLVFQIGVEKSNQADLGAILEDRYGKEIYELNKENTQKFTDRIITRINERIINEINKI